MNHREQADLQVRGVERLHAAHFLNVLGRLFFHHVEHVIDGHDADQHAGGINDRQHRHVVFLERGHGGLLVVGGLERDVAILQQFDDRGVEVRDDEMAQTQPIDQPAFLIDDVKLVERLAFASDFAEMREDIGDIPVVMNGNVLRRHAATDGAFRIAEKFIRDLAFLRREKVEQLQRGRSGHLFEELGAVVGRKIVENLRDLLLAEREHQSLLIFEAEIFEDIGGEIMRQDAEQHGLVPGAEVGENFRDLRRRELRKNFAQLREVALFNQGFEFRLDEIADHVRKLNPTSRAIAMKLDREFQLAPACFGPYGVSCSAR